MSSTIHNEYVNFIGVVEDINDPKELGRIRVRCVGFHTDSRKDIPTNKLPWAHVTMPVTSASLAGIGQSSTGVVQGSWVTGFFIDGKLANNPIVIGTLPSMSGKKITADVGFNDPDGIHPVEANVPDIPKEATSGYKASTAFEKKLASREIFSGVNSATSSWGGPAVNTTTAPKYPDCHVTHTLSGHTIEYDDTPGKERICIQHRTGTHIEMDMDGNIIEVVENNGFRLTKMDENHYIQGAKNITVDGSDELYVKGTQYIKVDGNVNMAVAGDVNYEIGKNFNVNAGAEIVMNAKAIRLN